jgi:hypothetical protein
MRLAVYALFGGVSAGLSVFITYYILVISTATPQLIFSLFSSCAAFLSAAAALLAVVEVRNLRERDAFIRIKSLISPIRNKMSVLDDVGSKALFFPVDLYDIDNNNIEEMQADIYDVSNFIRTLDGVRDQWTQNEEEMFDEFSKLEVLVNEFAPRYEVEIWLAEREASEVRRTLDKVRNEVLAERDFFLSQYARITNCTDWLPFVSDYIDEELSASRFTRKRLRSKRSSIQRIIALKRQQCQFYRESPADMMHIKKRKTST